MNQRPKIKIELTPFDKALELTGWMMVILLWAFAAYNYSTLPDKIPTHFNAAGQVDDYGSKIFIFLLPVIGTLLYPLMTVLNKFPHIFNYPKEITAENAEAQYTNATRLMRYLKLGCMVTFFIIEYTMAQVATGKSVGLGTWFLPLTLAFTLIPVLYFATRAMRKK
jgi:uncharacterized membrane protein